MAMNRSELYSFGSLLKVFRKRSGFTQQQLATSVGVHRNAVGRWEQGDFLPESKAIVLELARLLRLDEHETRQLLEASLTAIAPHWNIPYPRNPLFTGREETLRTLHEHLQAERASALTRSYALYGLGGMGKTHTMVEYVYRHGLEYSAVFWIAAESTESIMASFLRLAELLQLPEKQEADQQQMAIAVQRWLTHHRDWLMIWDNVEDVELIQRFLPPAHQGTVLMTTRRPVLGTLAQGLELKSLAQEEGILFLLRRAKALAPEATQEQKRQFLKKKPQEYEAARQLAATLDGLPLALDQAGAYLEETCCSVTDYLHRYQVQRQHLLNRRGTLGGDHPQSVAATLSLAYEQVKQANPAAAELVLWCAFLNPSEIPEELLTAGAAQLEPALQQVVADPYQFDLAIATLRSFSLVNRDAGTHTLSLHRLVQDVLKDRIDAVAARQWAERTVRGVDALFPDGTETENWPLCQRYLTQMEVCSHLIEEWKLVSLEAGRLLRRVGVYLVERARYMQAEQLLQQAHDISLQVVGCEHVEIGESLDALAMFYQAQGRYEEAESLYQRALHIREQSLGPEHRETANSLANLASLYWYWGKYEQAEPLLLHALRIQEQVLGREHRLTADSLASLATLYWSWEKYKQAEQFYLRTLRIREQVLGPEHRETASSLNGLALVYKDQGRYEEAEQYYLRTLRIWEHILGSEHPDVAIGLSNLGRLYADQGRYKEAEPLHQRALRIREELLGPEHPDTAISLNNLARLYADQGRYEEAEPLFQRAMTIRERRLGPEHPYVAITLNSLAKQYARQQRYEEAEPLFQRALAIRERRVGPESPAVAQTLNDLAICYCFQGKYEVAEPLFLRALAIREHHMGPEHHEVAESLNGLRTLYEAQGRSDRAEIYLRLMYTIQRVSQ